jgi:hypothetical protein
MTTPTQAQAVPETRLLARRDAAQARVLARVLALALALAQARERELARAPAVAVQVSRARASVARA